MNTENSFSFSFFKRALFRLSFLVFLAAPLLLSPTLLIAASEINPGDRGDVKKTLEYSFPDGAKIAVHFTENILKGAGEDDGFAKSVLDAAVLAYQTITQFQGFSTPGFSFALPDKKYAYDPDRIIDVYIGDPASDAFKSRGFEGASFKDAPCFDTVKLSKDQYQAVILLPAKYKEFIKNWEHLNPSSLGTRNVEVDLRGTLMHEMLHAILFYYNKNLNKDISGGRQTVSAGEALGKKEVDWYVEGLARYFETFGGARHDFFSQGFKQVLPDKIRFSRGGSNYYMRYPDQSFTHLRYENALFWRFIDYHYGMTAIEELSRNLRGPDRDNFMLALEKITKSSFNDLLKKFARALLFKDFGLKEDSPYLRDVAKTQLLYKNKALYLKDGFGSEKNLGNVCSTDWIGEWGGVQARLGDFPVGGDATEGADVAGWATDYYQLDIDPAVKTLPYLGITYKTEGEGIAIQLALVTKAGSVVMRDLGIAKQKNSLGMDLEKAVRSENLKTEDIGKIFILITNTDLKKIASYDIKIRA